MGTRAALDELFPALAEALRREADCEAAGELGRRSGRARGSGWGAYLSFFAFRSW